MKVETAIGYATENLNRLATLNSTTKFECDRRWGFEGLYCALGDQLLGIGLAVACGGVAIRALGELNIPYCRLWGTRVMMVGGALMLAGIGIPFGLNYPTHRL